MDPMGGTCTGAGVRAVPVYAEKNVGCPRRRREGTSTDVTASRLRGLHRTTAYRPTASDTVNGAASPRLDTARDLATERSSRSRRTPIPTPTPEIGPEFAAYPARRNSASVPPALISDPKKSEEPPA